MKRLTIWSVLICISLIVHAIISWRVGRDIDNLIDTGEAVGIKITVVEPPKPEAIERPPPEDALESSDSLSALFLAGFLGDALL